MLVVEILLGLLLLVGALSLLSSRFGLPLPVVLLVAGISLGCVPMVPRVVPAPDVIFLLFVPPLVYVAAYFASWRDLRTHARPISLLAIALVITTLVAVAAIAHALLPGFSWPLAFVLGAIVAPSDAVAVVAILKGLQLPRRLESILEGESLLNDPIALVSYRLAVGAVVGGGVSLLDAGWHLALSSVGGIAVGLATGHVLLRVRGQIEDVSVATTLALLSPYVAFLPGEWLGTSGVVSTLVAGLYMGWLSPPAYSSSVRLQNAAAWNTLSFVLNGLVFMFLGMELPAVIGRLAGHDPARLATAALAIAATTIGVRIAWVFGTAGLHRLLGRFALHPERPFPWQEVVVISWTGTRGVDSLVTALALPLSIQGGAGFPQRDMIIFLAAMVIAATLLLQGLSLPPLVRRLGLADGLAPEREENQARLRASQAALQHLERQGFENEDLRANGRFQALRLRYQSRLKRYENRLDGQPDAEQETQHDAYHELLQEAIEAERRAIIMLRDEGTIGNTVMHRLERDLDLESARHRGHENDAGRATGRSAGDDT